MGTRAEWNLHPVMLVLASLWMCIPAIGGEETTLNVVSSTKLSVYRGQGRSRTSIVARR